MSEWIVVLGLLIFTGLVAFAMKRGGKLSEISVGELMRAKFADQSSTTATATLIVKVPENVAWWELNVKFDGKPVTSLKIQDRGGQETTTQISLPHSGNYHYNMNATGMARLLDTAGQTLDAEQSVSGSGTVHVVDGEKLVVYQVADVGVGVAKLRLVLDTYSNYQNRNLPDDVAGREIERWIDES